MRRFALLVGLLFLGVFLLSRAAPHLIPVPRVKVTPVRRADLVIAVSPTSISSVVSERECRVACEVGGRLVELPWEEGDPVEAGAVVARVDDAAHEAALRRAEALAAVAAARLAMGEAAVALERVQIELSLEAAETTLALARKSFVRSDELTRRGGAARAKYDLERQNYEVALVTRDAKGEMRRKLDLLEAECAVHRAALRQAEADVALARITLERCTVRAPYAGVVSRRHAVRGETVAPGQPLVTLIDPDAVYLNALIDEVDIGRVEVGSSCEISLDAFPERPLAGRVIRVSPVVTGFANQTKTFAVRAVPLVPSSLPMKPGQSCDLRIHVETAERALVVPVAAMHEKAGRRFVYAVTDGRLARREIAVGRTNWTEVEVTDGLAEGDLVVASLDTKGLVAGSRVEVETETE